MQKLNRLRVTIWSLFGVLILLINACSPGFDSLSTPGPRLVPVDPVFKEFYQTLGGQAILGPAINQLEIRENIQCQFTERALLCINPSVMDSTRFFLYPLGHDLGVEEQPHMWGGATDQNGRIEDGFVIYDKFIPQYDLLYGANYVGRPLTEMRINADLQRVEQFFENVGFYQSLDDPNGPVYLIPYGAYLCGGSCSYWLSEYWSIVKGSLAEQPFAAIIARIGGSSTFGTLMLKPQIAADGSQEQVYANAIFYAPLDNLLDIKLRPLPKMLGYKEQPLVAKKSHDQLVFYEITGGLGHNVPKPFDFFIANHGGRPLSGNPLMEVAPMPDPKLYQQCFENYCLIYEPDASEMLKVRLAPLGKTWIEKNPPAESLQIRNMFSPDKIRMRISEDKPNIKDNEEQYIRLVLQHKDTEKPMERVEAELVLNILNRPPARFFFPSTDADGLSIVTIPAQPGLPNSTRLSYSVCLNLPSDRPLCAVDSYLIWNDKE